MNTDLSVVVVLAEKVPVTPPQESAQLKLLFHAQLEGKSPAAFNYLFIYFFGPIWPFAEDLADSTYLHDMINFSPSAVEPELISLFTVNWLIAWEQNNVHSRKGFN